MTEKILLDVEKISINFGGIKAVDDFTFHVNEGEIISIIGPNGAGKTTAFNLLTGIYKSTSGRILFKGEEIQNKSPQDIVKKGISRTFQNIRLYKNMKVIENVLVGNHTRIKYNFYDSIFKTNKFKNMENESVLNALKILESLNMYNKKDYYADSLPYGDQRKVEIARSIATGAELILLDEPAAGMNPQESEELLSFIKGLRKLGITVLLIEHDMNVVMRLSDRIYVLDNGRLIADGKPDEIVNNEKVIKAYLGSGIDVTN